MPHKTDMQVALISGGTSGIGMATAELLLKQGWCVVINGRHEKDGQRAALKLRRFSSKVRFVVGDVSKVDDCKRIVKQTVDMFGDISALVTAAGYYEEELLLDVTEQSFDEMFGTNVKGTVFLCQAALPYIRNTKGSIVTVSSDAGLQGNVACSVYGASKGAVVSFTKSLSLEMAPHGVRVNCVCPGDVDTSLVDKQIAQTNQDAEQAKEEMGQHYPLGRIGKPHEIGEVIAFLLSSKASFVTGAAWTIDGGLTSW
ncbi:SDR family oxidoreductase [Veillonella sp. YH-vei2232]|uniref:SDR family oxidoreductase n=1 Tax=Veillonella absiana TaxID=3079305 RepID=A0ABU3Z5U7_9FIRM|nr:MULTISPECIES: SDR family oxidoreductase [unclassified Veillonella]MDV5063819.1 SDR family oxidoreductase [Veillonella sp. YH-vei2232]MDV5087283.1 SDR family oxidoreductase [Veillonella sp. YH-vei2233]